MASNQPSVFIDGEAGTTGLGIRKRLEMVPEIALRSLPAAQRKDSSARQDMMAACDLVVLCLPDDAAREAAALAAQVCRSSVMTPACAARLRRARADGAAANSSEIRHTV